MNTHSWSRYGLIAATGLTRFAFRSHYLYDVDSVNFALALRRFDPSVHQPHPPGYFLYVCLGRLSNMIFHDANTALVAISIVFSCGAVAMIHALAESWFGRRAALFAGMIFLCSPLAWFHGTVALTYIVEAFFSVLVGFLCWQVYSGAVRLIAPAAMVLGIAAGFRPSSLLFLGPLFLLSLRGVKPRAGRRQIAGGIAVLALTILAWFVPMLRISGSQAYFSSLLSLWLTVPAKESIFNSSILNSLARAVVIVGVYFLCFGCAALLPVGHTRRKPCDDRRKIRFTQVWIAPGLLFFIFIYLKFVNSGYLLIFIPPICAWMGLWGADWYGNLRITTPLRIAINASCVLTNVAIFLWAPFYCSYREVRRFEAELGNIVATLPQIAPQGETMIVGLDSHFLGYRHAGYYLPAYLTVQFPEVSLAGGMSVFAMKDRETDVQGRIFATPARSFVIFPLPGNDSEYSDYMAMLRKRFPPGDLRMILRGGHEFAIGPIADLHFLFPASAPRVMAVGYAD